MKKTQAEGTSCYEFDTGLVTVYGEDGEMIANANF